MTIEFGTVEWFREEIATHGVSDEWTAAHVAVKIGNLAIDVERGVRDIRFFRLEYMAWLGAERDNPEKSDSRGYAQKVTRIECTLSELEGWLSFFRSEYQRALPANVAAAFRHAEVAMGHRPLIKAIEADMGTMGNPHWYWAGKLLAKRFWRILPMAVTVLSLLALTNALVVNLVASSGQEGVHRLLAVTAAVAACGLALRYCRR